MLQKAGIRESSSHADSKTGKLPQKKVVRIPKLTAKDS